MITTSLKRPSIIASSINEQSHVTGGLSTSKSFECRLQFSSSNQNLSPVIDVGTIGALGIMNRINDIDSSSDLPTQDGSHTVNRTRWR